MKSQERMLQINTIMEKRAILYDWMRQVFISEPSLAFIKDMTRAVESIQLSGLSDEERLFILFFQELKIEECVPLHNEIKPEYARLFIGPKQKLAPPYESIYRSTSRTFFGESTLQIREYYEKADLQVEKLNSEPDDHIGLELEYMFYMSVKTYESTLKDGDVKVVSELLNSQLSFLEQHLAVWVTPFTDDIIEHSNLEFFRVSARFLNYFIIQDIEVSRGCLKLLHGKQE